MESTKGLENFNHMSRVYHRASLTWSNGSKSLCEWNEHQICEHSRWKREVKNPSTNTLTRIDFKTTKNEEIIKDRA